MTGQLPEGFEALEPFVEQWALPTGGQRAEMRGASSPDDRKAFYEAASARVDEALALLDAKPLAEHDDSERRLMQLMLSLTHVAMAEEVHKEQEPQHARFRSFMPVTRTPADY